jgi:lactoylglutathione lyase
MMRTLHVGLRVENLQRSLEFYENLGYEVVGTVPETESGDLTMLKLPEDDVVRLELVHQPDAGRIDPRGISHLVIQVEDLLHTVTRLSACGIPVDQPSSPDGSDDFWTAMLSDPDGYRIELVQWPVGHANGMTDADFQGEAPQTDEPHDQTRCGHPE